MTKKALVLGGSIQQLPLIKELKSRGIDIVLVDYTDSPPGKKLSSKHYKISTFDLEGALEVAKKENVDTVCTMATDQPVLTASFVAENLGIYHPLTYKKAISVTNKSEMKRTLLKNSIKTPKFKILSEKQDCLDINNMKLPFVIKPVDSQGQRGITVVKNLNEIYSAFKLGLEYSRSKKVIVEELIKGAEYTANAFVKNGIPRILLTTKRNHYDDTKVLGVCSSHSFNFRRLKKKYYLELLNVVRKITSTFDLYNTPLYVQLVLNSNGWNVIELACRIGGGFESYLIPIVTGFNIVKEYTNLLLRKNIKLKVKNQAKYASSNFIFCKPGIISGYSNVERLQKQRVIDHFFPLKAPGDVIGNFTDATSRVACYIISDNNLKRYMNKLKVSRKAIAVYNEKGENLVINEKYRMLKNH